MSAQKFKRAFTLIELLVVIAIISILVTIAIASFSSAGQKGRDAKRKGDLDAIKKALVSYSTDKQGTYPINMPAYAAMLNAGYYIAKPPPKDPSTNTYYTYVAGPSGCSATNSCTTFTLYACLENTNDPQATLPPNNPCDPSPAYAVTDP